MAGTGMVATWEIFKSPFWNFRLYFTENRLFWTRQWLWRHCASYLRHWYLFWYVWKEEIPSYTTVPIRCIWGFISSSRGDGYQGGLDVLQKKKGLIRRGLKYRQKIPYYFRMHKLSIEYHFLGWCGFVPLCALQPLTFSLDITSYEVFDRRFV